MLHFIKRIDGSPVWSLVGKLGVVFTAIVGFYAVLGNIHPDKPNVSAICTMSTQYERPKALTDAASKTTEVPSEKDAVPKRATELFDDAATVTFTTFRIPPEVLSCEVRNTGTQEAKDVVLELPFSAIVVKLGEKVLSPLSDSSSSVALGAIRPTKSVSVLVWGNGMYYGTHSNSGYSLFFAGGVGTVNLPTLSYGFAGKVAEILNVLIRMPSSVILLALLGGGLFSWFLVPTIQRYFNRESSDSVGAISLPSVVAEGKESATRGGVGGVSSDRLAARVEAGSDGKSQAREDDPTYRG